MARVPYPARLALLLSVWVVWWWAAGARLSSAVNLSVIAAGTLLVFPLSVLGRALLDRRPNQVAWTTTLVHFALGFLFGVPIVRAVETHRDWSGAALRAPRAAALALVILAAAAFLATVANLAVKGLGAPFFIALSRKLAADWLYRRTRNPMALAGVALLVSLGIWFQSWPFVLWALLLFAPALLVFLKVFEERELEIRFGAPYREYKSRTPMLFRGPGAPARPANP